MLDWSSCPVVERSPETVSGAWVFRGTRIPVSALFENLEDGARVEDFISTPYGNLRIRDYQQFLPFGGRVILPFADDRVHIYGGGGGAYIRYSERVRQPYQGYGYQIDCVECASRDGIGYYAKAGVSVALDRMQMFRVGFSTKVYRGATEGDPFGPIPEFETRDRWMMLMGTFSFNF